MKCVMERLRLLMNADTDLNFPFIGCTAIVCVLLHDLLFLCASKFSIVQETRLTD
jgi:hypothetical protein